MHAVTEVEYNVYTICKVSQVFRPLHIYFFLPPKEKNDFRYRSFYMESLKQRLNVRADVSIVTFPPWTQGHMALHADLQNSSIWMPNYYHRSMLRIEKYISINQILFQSVLAKFTAIPSLWHGPRLNICSYHQSWRLVSLNFSFIVCSENPLGFSNVETLWFLD